MGKLTTFLGMMVEASPSFNEDGQWAGCATEIKVHPQATPPQVVAMMLSTIRSLTQGIAAIRKEVPEITDEMISETLEAPPPTLVDGNFGDFSDLN